MTNVLTTVYVTLHKIISFTTYLKLEVDIVFRSVFLTVVNLRNYLQLYKEASKIFNIINIVTWNL